jgi:hypothetical protein
MSQITLFVQVQGESRITEVTVAENVTESELHQALLNAGIPAAPDQFVFIDEDEEPVHVNSHRAVPGVKQGSRVHVARCRRIEVTVHFLKDTIERGFPPGARIRSVKKWAAHEFKIDHKDAAEHVLQICNSSERPASDTPLHSLAGHQNCAVCFDLIPEKRVEG